MNAPILIVAGKVASVKIFGEATGIIAATSVQNAEPPLIVNWASSPGATLIDDESLDAKYNLRAGLYRLSVTDATRRVSFKTYKVTENRQLIIYHGQVVNIEIFGDKTGSIQNVYIAGGDGNYTIYWSTDSPTPILDNNVRPKLGLAAGNYTMSVIDGVGATTNHTFTITQTNQLTLYTGRVKNAPIHGTGGGSIPQTLVSGGAPPYSFTWRSTAYNTAPAPVITLYEDDGTKNYVVDDLYKLLPDNYLLSVTDSVGAVAQYVYKVNEGPEKVYYSFGSSSNFGGNRYN